DLRNSRSDPDLCSSLPPIYRTQRLRSLGDLLHAVQNWKPWAMCFEYDWPDTSSLAAVLEVRARHPSLPIILLTARTVSKSRIETLDQPTPRVGVWNHLLKPVSVTRFCECLTGLTRGPLPAARCRAGRGPRARCTKNFDGRQPRAGGVLRRRQLQ